MAYFSSGLKSYKVKYCVQTRKLEQEIEQFQCSRWFDYFSWSQILRHLQIGRYHSFPDLRVTSQELIPPNFSCCSFWSYFKALSVQSSIPEEKRLSTSHCTVDKSSEKKACCKFEIQITFSVHLSEVIKLGMNCSLGPSSDNILLCLATFCPD